LAGKATEYGPRPLGSDDWPRVREIYLEGILTGNATFAAEVSPWESSDNGHLQDCRFVDHDDSVVLGWAALRRVSTRRVYAGATEVSVYVTDTARQRGVGRAVLSSLIRSSEAAGIWTLQAGILPENVASIHLHKSLGFREVGRRERVGKMGDRWRDGMLLERRSRAAGIS